MDIFPDNLVKKRIETKRFGVFKLVVGLDASRLELPLQRVIDAQARFSSSPLSSVANRLEKEVVVNSVFGTNTIEGGELSEKETADALNLQPEEIQNIQQKRAVNIKEAYSYIKDVATDAKWSPSLSNIVQIHKIIYDGLDVEGDITYAGILRDNPKEKITQVGNDEHGGSYKPPQCGDDIRLLLMLLLDWNKELAEQGLPALIRAPLVHLYFELIHPFWDGNGRVGRVLEAGILYSEGFRYAPFAQANYYLKNIHHYFSLFNATRKLSKKDENNGNTDFVLFFLEGMLETINGLHDRVNDLVSVVLYVVKLKELRDDKAINQRQYAIVNEVLNNGSPLSSPELVSRPAFVALYAKLTNKTMLRDFSKLAAMKLVVVDDKKRLSPQFFE